MLYHILSGTEENCKPDKFKCRKKFPKVMYITDELSNEQILCLKTNACVYILHHLQF